MPTNAIAKRTLREFWDKEPKAKAPLEAWYGLASKARWGSPQDIKNVFGTTVDFIGDNRIIFDIGGNKYRLVVHAAYRHKVLNVKFVGTHKQYDAVDPETI